MITRETSVRECIAHLEDAIKILNNKKFGKDDDPHKSVIEIIKPLVTPANLDVKQWYIEFTPSSKLIDMGSINLFTYNLDIMPNKKYRNATLIGTSGTMSIRPLYDKPLEWSIQELITDIERDIVEIRIKYNESHIEELEAYIVIKKEYIEKLKKFLR